MDQISQSWRDTIEVVVDGLSASTEKIYQTLLLVCRLAAEDVGSAESSILIPIGEGENLRFLVSHSAVADELKQLRIPVASSVAGRVFATGQTIAVEDEPPQVPIPGEPPKIYLAQPLTWASRTIGVATYVNRPKDIAFERFTKNELIVASRYSVIEAILLRQYFRMQSLEQLANADMQLALDRLDGSHGLVKEKKFDQMGDGHWRETVTKLSRLDDNEMLLATRFVDLLDQWSQGKIN